MKKEVMECDISERNHSPKVETITLDVIFEHDQEDGKSKCGPYLSKVTIEICESCKKVMLNDRKYIYAYGAMGHNTYTL